MNAYTNDLELEQLQALCTGRPRRISEGGQDYILLPSLTFVVGGVQRSLDALLSPKHSNPTYPTKLWFPEKVPFGSLNWNEELFVESRCWYSWSWKNVAQGQPLLAIVSAHLGAFR